MRSGGGGAGGGRGGGDAADVKSNNPHLTVGEFHGPVPQTYMDYLLRNLSPALVRGTGFELHPSTYRSGPTRHSATSSDFWNPSDIYMYIDCFINESREIGKLLEGKDIFR